MITSLRQALGAALLLILAGAASAQQTTEAAEQPGEISLYVFDSGRPVEGLTVRIGSASAVTDETGGVFLRIPPGRREVVVTRDAEQLLNLDLLTAEGENVQVLVTLKGAGQPPEVDIESSDPNKAGTVQPAGGPRDAPENRTPGLLKGRVLSVEQGEPVANARIFFAGVETQVRTNARGEFQAELPAGNYSLSVIHEDFATRTVDNVRVIPQKEVTTTIELTPAGVQLQEYVVTAPYIEGSVASAITDQRETSAVSEVLGAEQMSKAGDSDAAEALQRVTGLTIEDGKYVVIRGQPSRYTLTLMNGSPLPSPDPIRSVVPLDLFPTGVLSGIEVQKSYSADKPGSFGGGLISLNTRGLPKEGFAEISAGTGFNTASTGESGRTYDGGNELFGVTDDQLELPSGADQNLGALPADERNAIGREFPNNYQATEKTLPPDQSLSATGGGSFETAYGDFGVLGSFSWGRKWRYTEERDIDYKLGNDNALDVLNDRTEQRTDLDISLGGLLAVGGRWENHELTSNTFFIRDTTKRTEISEGEVNTSDNNFVRDYTLEWNQRELLVEQLLGSHDLDFVRIDWRAMFANSTRESPDRRTYRYTQLPDGSFVMDEDQGAQRRYNSVDDDITSFGVDLNAPIVQGEQLKLNLRAGAATDSQERQSETQRYKFAPTDVDVSPENPEEILDPSEIGDGVEFRDVTGANDDYTGEAQVQAVYLLGDLEWLDTLRLVTGLRQEQASFEVRSFQSSGGNITPVTATFDETRLLPSVSATWFVTADQQLRLSYGKTVSRPLLVEISQTTFFDPDTGQEFLGNPDLTPAVIDSYDLRWEWYPSGTENLTAGVFYKRYADPIERSFTAFSGGGNLITLRNAEEATVTGAEIGGRWDVGAYLADSLDWSDLEGSYLSVNYAHIDSEVTLDGSGIATNTSRPLEGQAEYVANLQLGYEGQFLDWNLAFNRVGRRLDTAGVAEKPDVYQEPVSYLDAVVSYSPWKPATIKLSGSNLLNPKVEYTQGGETERSLRKGATYGLSFKWKFQ